MIREGMVNAEVFVQFLHQLTAEVQYPTVSVVDGHSIYNSSLAKAHAENTAGLLDLVCLPPYSPQLNPDEPVCKHVKNEISQPMANKFYF